MLSELDHREKFIILARFSLGSHRKVSMLQALANRLDGSKERVRQLEHRGLEKLQIMLIKLRTGKSVTDAAAALQIAVTANHFGIMQVHNLQETMQKKEVDFGHECLIFEVC